ncbi:transcriptional regulator [Tessaracoccus sp. MC1679]|uniref:transcriptional regulator n=1 Tax=Tessaracoccus sp. MC1679 TaxID=2760313 RepID=UPI0016048AAF|nr:transcriptional regulator [Tessaracoccus sp. MC1679]MBB1517586.1 transcriptional regulator [Tessaracoccus sp. MC1679]
MSWEPPVPRFDDLIHAPTRLRITAALATATDLEFSALEDALEISTSLLSKQLKLLAQANYLTLEKRPQPFGRPRTWIRLTPAGRTAYLGHVQALRQLTETEEPSHE